MHCDQARELLSARLDGELGSAERAAIDLHVRDCPDCQKEAEVLKQQDTSLRSVFTPRRQANVALAERVISRLQTVELNHRPVVAGKARRFVAVLLALAALVVMAVALPHLMHRNAESKKPPQERQTAEHGKPLDGKPAHVVPSAPAVASGEFVRTGPGERRRARMPDGSVLCLNQNTVVKIGGPREVTLSKGEVYVEVSPRQPGAAYASFRVKTPQREVTALGTHFDVTATERGTGVVVTQGKVKVTGLESVLRAGQEVLPGEGELVPTPRVSHLLDWARELIAAEVERFVPESRYGGGALVAIDPYGQETKLQLRNYHIDVHIEDGFARTTIDQTYFNRDNWRMEGTFYFPLPPDASLSRLAMYVNGQLMEGGMAERNFARDVYEQILYRQRDPALLEWIDGSTFKMRVFPLEPRQEKRIVLSYTQRLETLYGRTRYRFPAGHTLPLVRDWSFHAVVKGGARTAWGSESHKIRSRTEGKDLILDSAAKNVRPDRDVVLDLDDGEAATDSARCSSAVHEGKTYLMLRYRPTLTGRAGGANPLPARPSRHWLFLFESSGDRDALLARAQTSIVRTLLSNAEHDDTFTILTAGTRVHAFPAQGGLSATPENIDQAAGFLSHSRLIGALDLGHALEEAAASLRGSANSWLVHVGSGVAAMGENRNDTLATKIPTGTHYVGIGVGKRWNRSFMKQAAERTGGYFAQINPDEEVAWRAFDLLATLNTPRLLNVHVVDNAEKAHFLTFTSLLADGEELAAVARLAPGEPLPQSVTVAGTLDDQPWQRVIPVRNVAENAGYLPRTWARLKIDEMLATMSRDAQGKARTAKEQERIKNEIIALSKAMYVMTPFTSLLVLENEEMYARFKVDRGRKDHWAMYPLPAKIPVVTEPDPSQPLPKNGKQKPTVDQVLQTIVLRVQPRFMTWPGEQAPYGGKSMVTVWSAIHESNVHTAGRLREFNEPLGDVDATKLGRGEVLSLGLPVRWQSGQPSVNPDQQPTAYVRMLRTDGTPALNYFSLVQPQDQYYGESSLLRETLGAGITKPQSTLGFVNPFLKSYAVTNGDAREVAVLLRDRFKGATITDHGNDAEIVYGTPADQREIGKRLGSANQEGAWMFGLGVNSDAGLVGPVSFGNGRLAERRGELNYYGYYVPNGLMGGNGSAVALPPLTTGGVAGVPFGDEPAVEFPPAGAWRALTRAMSSGLGQTAADYVWTATARAGSLYQRPTFTGDDRVFFDLVAYAPGMNTSIADVLAVLDAEALPRGHVELGTVTPRARRLIDRTRQQGWQKLTIPGESGQPELQVVFDGHGRFRYERTIGLGRREEVICDGKTLVHLYPDLGIGARRQMSRFHRASFGDLLPWVTRPAEDWIHGSDLSSVNDHTVVVSPIGAVKARDARGKPITYHCLHLVFAPDGRLRERQLVTMPEGKVLAREIYAADGTIRVLDSKGKRLSEQKWRLSPATAPNLSADRSKLVVLPLPWRTREHVVEQYSIPANPAMEDMPEKEAVALFAADFATNNAEATQVFGRRFHSREIRPLGFYTFLAAAGINVDAEQQYLNLMAEHPADPLAKYLAFHGNPELRRHAHWGELNSPRAGMLHRLGMFRVLWMRWQGDANRASSEAEQKQALDFVRANHSLLGWTLLGLLQRQAGKHPRFLEAIAASYHAYATMPGLAYLSRYEEARSLLKAGRRADARKRFGDLYADTLKRNMLPSIDADFRLAMQQNGPLPEEWTPLIRRTAESLVKDKHRLLAIALAWQCWQLGDQALADNALSAALDRLPNDDRLTTTLAAIEFFLQVNQPVRADDLLRPLLADADFGKLPGLWRIGMRVASARKQSPRELACLEQALKLESKHLPEVINLAQVRTDYGALLDHYQQVVNAMQTLQVQPPADFAGRVVEAADRWRALDHDDATPCTKAGTILETLGQKDLAWEFLTTPIGLQPSEAAPWVTLAESERTGGDYELADRAFRAAFESEPTNAQLLWDRAQNLQQAGRKVEAQRLYRALADGHWQPRFSGLQEQARWQVTR